MKITHKSSMILLLIISSLLASGQSIPPYFDLRDVNGNNYVTSIKMQQGGTCWTHGAMAAIEGNMLMTNVWYQLGEQGEPDLAEYHLDWWNGFNQHNNDDYSLLTGNGLVVHNGGDYRVTAAYLSRGEGAVREIDAPSFNTAPLRHDTNYHYYYPRTIEWFNVGLNLERINTIKKLVMNQGVVGTCMCVGFWENGNIHYQPQNSTIEPNHAVAIIGWNDTLITSAPGPGAWLVKNSWGATWGNSGYFWISYYDKHCGQEPQMGAVSFQEVERMQYKKVFFHDYHGWRDELNDCYEAFNAFVNGSDFEEIEAISFYNAADSVNFIATIYKNFSNDSLKNPLSSINGFINHAGFHTFDLDSTVALNPNDSFYLYLYLSDGGQPYDRSSEVPVLLGSSWGSGPIIISKSSFKESFYKQNGGNWLDFHNYDSTGNFCMKALSNPLLPKQAQNPIGDSIICSNIKYSTFYIQPTDYASTYNWHIMPTNAGTVSFNDTVATIKWDSTFTGSASIYVTPINSNGVGNKGFKNINYFSLPVINLGNDTTILEHHSITLEVNQGYSAYLWSNGTTNYSNSISGLTLGLGIHPIWIEITDSNQCKNSDTLLLEIQTDAGISYVENKNIIIYPNPVEKELNLIIEGQNSTTGEIEIYDNLGKIVFRTNLEIIQSQNKYTILLPELTSGIYHLSIKTPERTLTEKVIINQINTK